MKGTLRNTVIYIISCFMFWSCSETSAGSFTMVLSGSVHGQLDPCGWKKNPLGGLSRRIVKINEMRADGIDPLILDAGDIFFSTSKLDDKNRKSQIHRAKSIISGYGKIGCNVINVGHYEVLNGLNFLNSIIQDTEIPFISANLRDSKSKDLLFEPYKIFKRDGLKIGVVGVTSNLPDTSNAISADNYIVAGNSVFRWSDIGTLLSQEYKVRKRPKKDEYDEEENVNIDVSDTSSIIY